MKFSVKSFLLMGMLLAFSGCVTSHYKNDKGCECTRRYFTVFGIPTHSCSDACQATVEPAKAPAEAIQVAPPETSSLLQKSTPAKTAEQNIPTTPQPLNSQ